MVITTIMPTRGTNIAMLERGSHIDRLADDHGVTPADLVRLMTWLSPSYPVGAFAYSSGLEWSIEAGDIRDVAALIDWIGLMLTHGAGRNDAILFAETWQAVQTGDDARLRGVAELACALAPSRERHLETTAQGRAFLDVTAAAWHCAALDHLTRVWDGDIAYPVAAATACAGHGIASEASLHAFVHAIVVNWISAGVRLIPLGQTDSQRALAALETAIAACAHQAGRATLADLGSATFRADLASMQHETQYTRLFRS